MECYKNHPFFGSYNGKMFLDIDESLTYGVAFSEDLAGSLIVSDNHLSLDFWNAADRSFRYVVTSSQLLLRSYANITRKYEEMYKADYDLKGEFKASAKMTKVPVGTFVVDAQELPQIVSENINPVEIESQFFHLQAGFHVSNHLDKMVQTLNRKQYIERPAGFTEGYAAGVNYWMYAYASALYGRRRSDIAKEFNLPEVSNDKNYDDYTDGTKKTVDELKRFAFGSKPSPFS